MKRVRVTTTATAEIEETWVYEVPDDWEPDGEWKNANAEELLTKGDPVSMWDRTIGGERDREVTNVEDVKEE